jgi:predicted nucleic acid-binding protein
MIIDASVLLSVLFPDEAQQQAQAVIRDYTTHHFALFAPTLLTYELTNAVWQGVRRQRITLPQAEEMLQTFNALGINLEPVSWSEMLHWAVKYNRSAYDASYLALAQRRDEPLITADLRLYNTVANHVKWVIWLEDYQAQTPS